MSKKVSPWKEKDKFMKRELCGPVTYGSFMNWFWYIFDLSTDIYY